MSDERKPHPKNAPGPFYVENGCCMMCMAPHEQAPTLMGFDDLDGHCFVKQQPQTDEEIYLAICAVRSAEVQCLRYRGHDANILRRLVEIGEADACDLPCPRLQPRSLTNRWLVHHSPIWEVGSVGVSLMIDDWPIRD